MILLENKLAIFNKIVFLKKEQECDEELKRVEMEIENKLAEKKEELKRQSDELINRRKKLATQRGYEMIAKVNEDRRILELRKDEELLDDLLLLLIKRAKKFTETEEYVNFEKKRLESVLKEIKEKTFNLGLMKKDMSKLKEPFLEIIKNKNLDVEIYEIEEDKVGGFVITDKQKRYNIDCTLYTKIMESRYEIGKLLHFTLKKIGEKN